MIPPPPGSPPNTPPATPRALPLIEVTLDKNAAVRLEALLSDPALYNEPYPLGTVPPVGGAEFQMEVVTPVGHRTVSWAGRLDGKLGEVANAVLEAGR